jgi:hypothetical protein
MVPDEVKQHLLLLGDGGTFRHYFKYNSQHLQKGTLHALGNIFSNTVFRCHQILNLATTQVARPDGAHIVNTWAIWAWANPY